MKIVLVLSALLLWAGTAQAATLLSETFEGSDAQLTTNWPTNSYAASGKLAFCCDEGFFPSSTYQPFFHDTGVAFAGTKSIRFNYVGNQTQGWQYSGGAASQNYTPADEIWLTFYRRLSAGFVMAGGNVATKGPYMYAHSATKCVLNGTIDTLVTNTSGTCPAGSAKQKNGWVAHNFYYSPRQMSLSIQGVKDAVSSAGVLTPYGTQNLHQNVGVYNEPDLVWSCFELHLKWNTPGQANGMAQLYAQNMTSGGPNILVINAQNREFRDATTSGRMPSDSKWDMQQMYRQDGLGQMWYDNITIDTTRRGCGGAPPTPPESIPPSTVTASSSLNSGSQATITWTAATDNIGVTVYEVLRCTGSCTPTAVLTTVGGSLLTYVDTTLSTGTTYSYRIRAKDAAGNTGAASNTTTVTTAASNAFRRILAVDAFDRADNTDLGAAWDAGYTTNCQILSGRARATVLNTSCLETYNGVATPDDQWAQFTMPMFTGATASSGRVMLRWADAPTITGYRCLFEQNTTAFKIIKLVAGTPTEIMVNTTAAHQAGDIYRCEAQGTTLRFFQVRGTAELLLGSAIDADVASGKTGIGLYMATGGNLANAELDTFAMGDFVTTAPDAPSIATVIADATSAALTYGATTPTSIRVRWEFGSVVEPIANFPSGVYTYPPNVKGTLTSFICFDAMNAIGEVFNSICDGVPLTALDTAPVVMSAAFPTADLPAGTTSALIGFTIDKIAPCRWDTTDIAYEDMDPTTQQMTVANLTSSATVTGLSAGTFTYKGRCSFVNGNDDAYPNLSSITMTVTVAASTADTTAPSTVENLVATPLSNSQAQLVWTAATDDVAIAGYQVYQASGDCSTYALASGALVTTTTIQVTLAPSTVYCFKVLAVDTSNNLSADFSNIPTITTSGVVDITRPSTMVLRVGSVLKNSAVLEWDTCSDDSGTCTSTIEISPVGCASYAPSPNTSNVALSHLALTLSAGTSYCARGFHTDAAGNKSLDLSNEVTFTTATVGLPRPRQKIPFGVQRLPRTP